MSNLYKQRYTVNKDKNNRIINSNEIIEEKLRQLSRETAKNAKEDGGFVEGLHAFPIEVIPEEEPEPSMEEVREEAKRLIEGARERAQGILTKAEEQAEHIRDQARKDGFSQGLSDGREKAAVERKQQEQGIMEQSRKLEADYIQKMEELEPMLVDVISDVFEKVFRVQFDDKKDILLYLVQNTILNIEGSKEFQIRVSEQNYQFLINHKAEIMERVGNNLNIEILADSFIKENQCVIETDSGVFECGLGVQLENLIKAIRSLCL